MREEHRRLTVSPAPAAADQRPTKHAARHRRTCERSTVVEPCAKPLTTVIVFVSMPGLRWKSVRRPWLARCQWKGRPAAAVASKKTVAATHAPMSAPTEISAFAEHESRGAWLAHHRESSGAFESSTCCAATAGDDASPSGRLIIDVRVAPRGAPSYAA